jgi:DnaK suppressor protein
MDSEIESQNQTIMDRLLTRRREYLMTPPPALEAPLQQERTADELAMASVETMRAMSSSLGQRKSAGLRKIEDAMARLRQGTYGWCTECGDEISENRLLAVPEADLCLDCKEHEERLDRA